MRFFDIKENGGRVVKGVNTTPDVGVDAIKKQAAKFGNKVDKDGRPPTLSKKVKGSKTNVLFNLGMAESKQLNEVAIAAAPLIPVITWGIRVGGPRVLDMLGRAAVGKSVLDGMDLESTLSAQFPDIDVNSVPKDYDDSIQRVLRNPPPSNIDTKGTRRKNPELDKIIAFLIALIGSKLVQMLLAAGLTLLTIYALAKTAKYFKKKHQENKLEKKLLKDLANEVEPVDERSLSKGEEKKKEKYVKGMKKSKGDFKDRYGKDADAVMYATATKMAKEGQVHELQADELSEASEIYIDMDGVLVDFFGEWTKMQGVKDWKQIKNVGKALQDIRDTEDFWLNLKPTPNADKLLGLVKEIRGEYNILSAPLADDPRAEPHKREWIEKNLTAFPPKKVIITTDKAKYATSTGGTPNILIDDFGQNVAKWESAGGVGFKHKDHKFERTAKELKAHMNKPVDEEQVSELVVKQQRPKIDVIQNIADRKDSKPFPLSYKDTGGASTGGTISLTPDQARKFIKFYDGQEKENQQLMQKALTSVNNAKKLFNNFGMEVDVKLPNNPDADIPQSPLDKLKKNLDKDKQTSEGDLIPNPKDTFLTKSDTAYDFVRVGKTISNLDAVGKGANRDEPDVMIVPMGGKKEKKHLKKGLKRVGYKAQDADKPGDDAHVDEREEKVKSKDKEVMKGFDPETIQALAQLRAKYPHASDPLDALLKSVIDTDQDNDAVDDKQDSKLKRILKTIKQLEPKIRDLNNRLSGVEVQINNVGKK
jgi:5'(3')-deoxyribonucleotidase